MTPLPDLVTIHPPKEDEEYRQPIATTMLPAADIDLGASPMPGQIPVA